MIQCYEPETNTDHLVRYSAGPLPSMDLRRGVGNWLDRGITLVLCTPPDERCVEAILDLPGLLIQWVIVGVLTATFYLACRKPSLFESFRNTSLIRLGQR